MTRSKRFLTTLLATATVVTTMFVPAMADASEPAVNLTNYNTPYNTIVSLNGEDVELDLKVRGATVSWQPTDLTEEQAASVTWETLAGSTTTVYSDAARWYTDWDETAGDYAGVRALVPANAAPGFAVVEAKMGTVSMDFTVAINGQDPTSVSAIDSIFYDARGETETKLLEKTDLNISGLDFAGQTTYASAMDVPAALAKIADSGVTNCIYNNGMLKGVSINGTAYNTPSDDWTAPGWQYRVYGKDNKLKELSADVGADVFALEKGDTVVWKFGTYASVTFPAQLTK